MNSSSVLDAASVEQLYRDQGQKLWWALLAYSGDPYIASDALAEAFSRALASPNSIRDLAAWVWKVAFRVAATELRRQAPSIDRQVAKTRIDEETAEVVRALRVLSHQQRAVVVLYYADRPTKEIASMLGVSAATVAVHLHRARKRLKVLLEDANDA